MQEYFPDGLFDDIFFLLESCDNWGDIPVEVF